MGIMDDPVKATGIVRKFRVTVHRDYDVTIDEALMPDDEWRNAYFPFHTLREMAEFAAWNADITPDGLGECEHLYDVVEDDTSEAEGEEVCDAD